MRQIRTMPLGQSVSHDTSYVYYPHAHGVVHVSDPVGPDDSAPCYAS